MTTSGTYNFTSTFDFGNLSREAWERCQMLAETMTGWQLRSARQSLNLMLIEWAAAGINLWAVQQISLGPLAIGQHTVTTAAGTIDILEATISTTTPVSDERILGDLSRDEYVAYSNKLQSGRPSMIWVERVAPVPIIHLYPVPDASVVYSLIYYRMRLLQDVSAGSQTVDIAPLFLDALCDGLAYRLAAKWVKDAALRSELKQKAMASFMVASRQDTERVNLSLQPDISGWSPF